VNFLIELPTWLGDTIMTTPAIENLVKNYKNSNFTFIGFNSSAEIFSNHPNTTKIYVLKRGYKHLYKNAKLLGEYDVFISFRNSIRSYFFSKLVRAKEKFHYSHKKYEAPHQVEKYNSFVSDSLGFKSLPDVLKIYSDDLDTCLNQNKKYIGINPGATYGSAKRWSPEKFAEVAKTFVEDYEILIFGADSETDFASSIENKLNDYGSKNITNLSGKTSLSELISIISKLDIFITGDSGPMHIAGAFNIPTVAIFGPTSEIETCQWNTSLGKILTTEIDCRPCKKRVCKFGHNNCMDLIQPDDVTEIAKKLLNYEV